MRFLTRLLVVLLLASLALLIGPKQTFAANFDYSLASEFTVRTDKSTVVQLTFTVTNNTAEPTPSVLEIATAGNNVRDTSARYTAGGDIPTVLNQDTDSVRLDLPTANTGEGNQWSFVVNYTTDLVGSFGDSTVLLVPVIDYDPLNITSNTMIINADLELGLAVAHGPEPVESRLEASRQVLVYSSDNGVFGESVGLVFGNSAVATATFNTTLKNNSWWWQTMTFTLPPDTNQQQVWLESITPQPTNVRLDADGNILAEYRLRPKGSVDITAQALIAINNFQYTLTSDKTTVDIGDTLKERYTRQTERWVSTNLTVETSDDQPVVQQVRAVYDAVVAAIEVDELSGNDTYVAVRNRADQLVGELRSRSIPARVVLGQVFSDGNQVLTEARPHAWVEAFIPGAGWITLDPMFGTRSDTFGDADVMHVGLVLRGIEDDFPPEFLETVSISFEEDTAFPEEREQPQVHATNFMILPGLALRSVSVDVPSGTIVDDSVLTIDGAESTLGSLAPLQTATNRTFVVGGAAFSSGVVTFGFGGQDNLAETNLSVSYIPMIVLLVIIALLIVGRHIWRRHRHTRPAKKEKHKPTKDNVVLHTQNNGANIENDNLLPKRRDAASQSTTPTRAPDPPPTQDVQPPPPTGGGRVQLGADGVTRKAVKRPGPDERRFRPPKNLIQ